MVIMDEFHNAIHSKGSFVANYFGDWTVPHQSQNSDS